MNEILALVLFIYFLTSVIYSSLVYKFSYKSTDHLILNLLFGPIALLYNLYLIVFNKDIRI